MAASAAAPTYSAPSLKVSIGGRFLVVTEVSINAEAEEYKKGGISLEYGKLGLPDSLVDLVFLPSGFTDEKDEKQYDAQILKEKLILYASGKEKTFAAELSEAEGKALKGWSGLLLVVGR
jgi:hypothetical protein